jgi:hypothetical protein
VEKKDHGNKKLCYIIDTMGIISDKIISILSHGQGSGKFGYPGPVFWNDKDITGKWHNKSELEKARKERKKNKKNAN